jgi:hypothetical protein
MKLTLSNSVLFCGRWWHRKGSVDVGDGRTPRCFVSFISVYDSFHKLHSNNIVHCLWVVGSGLRCGMLTCRFSCHVWWPTLFDLPDETVSTQFLDCLFNRWRGSFVGLFDVDSVASEYGSWRKTSFGRHLWKGRLTLLTYPRSMLDFPFLP